MGVIPDLCRFSPVRRNVMGVILVLDDTHDGRVASSTSQPTSPTHILLETSLRHTKSAGRIPPHRQHHMLP